MPDASPPIAGPRWRHWYRRALPAYWLFLFCCTHLPIRQGRVPGGDKLAHFLAYGLLAFLFWRFAETFRRPLSNRFVFIALAAVAAYAALDEWLQPFVNRSNDIRDWAADVGGAAGVLLLLEIQRRMRLRRDKVRYRSAA